MSVTVARYLNLLLTNIKITMSQLNSNVRPLESTKKNNVSGGRNKLECTTACLVHASTSIVPISVECTRGRAWLQVYVYTPFRLTMNCGGRYEPS